MQQQESFLDLLKSLIRESSVVGAEHAFFRVLQRELEERGATVHWYQGVLVAEGSDPKSAWFSAHIDRHGLICTGPNEFQYAAFDPGTTARLEQICRDEGISYLYKDEYIDTLNTKAQAEGGETQSLGSTELGRIVAASNGFVQGTTLQLPTTGYHTMEESCSLVSNSAFSRVCMAVAGIT